MASMKEKLIDQLVKHEGEKLQVYECTSGFATIGVGRNLETKGLTKQECDKLNLGTYDKNAIIAKLEVRGITKEESRYLLSNDIDYFESELSNVLDWFKTMPETVKMVLIDMAFNLGVNGLLKFKKTLEFIKNGKFINASNEMLNSAWKFQVGQRAYDLSNQLRSLQIKESLSN